MKNLALSGALLVWLALATAPRIWAQPPPPEVAAPATAEIAGVGTVTLLEDAAEGDCAFSGKLEVATPAALKLTVVFDRDPQSGDHYQLRCTAQQAQFFLVRGGKAQPLGEAGAPPPLPVGVPVALTVRRDGWRLAFLLADRLVCTANDSTLMAGGVGYAVAGGSLPGPVLQFTSDLDFTDDFMRTTAEKGDWQEVSGQWRETSLRIDPQADTMQEDRSANAFSYEGHGTGDARSLAVAGKWFWADYRVEAAVRPLGSGACGLLICYHDPENYLGLRWTPTADGNSLQLIQRLEGEERVLSSTPGGFRPEQWYKLGLGVSDGCVMAWLDDEVRLLARTRAFLQGKVGLFVEGVSGANFDDVVVERWGYFADNFSTARRWDSAVGSWQRGDHRMSPGPAPLNLLLGPPVSWAKFGYSTDCHVEKGDAGLVFGAQGPDAYYVLRYNGDQSRVTLAQITGAEERELGSAPVERPTGQAFRLGVLVDRNLVKGLFGTRPVLYAALSTPPAGRLGLYARSAPGAWFSYAEAEEIAPPPAAHVTKEFRDDKEHWEMAKWATTRAPWQIPLPLTVENEGNLILKEVSSPREFGNNVWWSKGDFFGGTSIVFNMTQIGQYSGTLQVTVQTQPDSNLKPVGGYTLAITCTAGSPDLALALTSGAQSLGEAKVSVPDRKCTVEFVRSGPFLQVWIGKSLALQAEVSL